MFNAIKKDIPIIVLEKNALNPIDGELYWSLKMLGAKKTFQVDYITVKIICK